jgi:hypothetical protein
MNQVGKNSIELINQDLDELKRFILSIQKTPSEEKTFKPERLQHLRAKSIVHSSNSGLSS